MAKVNIAQIGTFDVENYGDLLFPIVFENKLKMAFEVKEFMIFSPLGGRKPLDNKTYVYPIAELEQMQKKFNFDAFVIGGGDLIRLDKGVSPTYPAVYNMAFQLWQEPIMIANRYNIPVIFNCPGVPFPFKDEEKEIVKELLETVDYCSVRNEKSKKHLEDCGVKNVIVSPDTIIRIFDVYDKEELSKFEK
ncbi:MAG: polysaccharide pyruvyl transferase family protein [Coprobacillaceae bacterium]